MNRVMVHILSLLVIMLVCACASVTTRQLIADGNKPLSQQELLELITDSSFHLEAIDFEAKIHFLPEGHLSCSDLHGTTEKGKWNITPENQLCMKFDRWYFGDLKCYTLFREKSSYLFFTSNGARYYTGKILPGTGSSVAVQSSSSNSQTVPDKKSSSAGLDDNGPDSTSRPTKAEKEHTLTNLARNCPDCNLSGVDLKGAQLIAANLTGADLSGADLSDANLRRANLIGANLSGAKLIRANLSGADLSGCDLSKADLTGSNLIRAIVTDANFDEAILSGAHLESIQGMKY